MKGVVTASVRSSLRILACSLVAAALTLTVSPAAHASTNWYVSPTGVDTSCTQTRPFLTIQFAIDCASPGDSIFIASGTYAQNLAIASQLTLVGAGAGSTLIEPTRGAEGSVVDISYSYFTAVRISGVTITGGRADFGGGIFNGVNFDRTSVLTLADSVVRANTATSDGDGTFNDVGSTVRLVRSRVIGNIAYDGRGLYNNGGGCFFHDSKIARNLPNDIVGC